MKKLTLSMLVCTAICYANPIATCDLPFISEIQIIDSVHWYIEIYNVYYNFSDSFKPCSTNSIMLYTDNNLSDSLHARPAFPIFLDTISHFEFIGVANQNNFPYVKIRPGDTIKFKYDYCRDNVYSTIVKTIPSTQSIVRDKIQCGMVPPISSLDWSVDYCYVYTTNKTPSIGKPNAIISGILQGHIYSNNNPVPGIYVVADPGTGWETYIPQDFPGLIKSKTDSLGYYKIQCSPGQPLNLLFYDSLIKSQVSQKKIGPLYTVQDSTENLDIELDDYTPVLVSPAKKNAVAGKELRIIGIARTLHDRSVTIALSAHSDMNETAKVGIYDPNGKLLFETPVFLKSSGTYVVTWNFGNSNGHGLPKGCYICRVQSGHQIIKKVFLLL